jgi:hypothetical protein
VPGIGTRGLILGRQIDRTPIDVMLYDPPK